MRHRWIRYIAPVILGLLVAGVTALHAPAKVLADPSTGDTFVVTTTNDLPDNNPGDGVCATGITYEVPECTLRAAIEEANANNNPSERDVITFTIEDGFKVSAINAYSIELGDTLDITQPVEINGYSQLGAVANTANAPEPFNGTLKVMVSGASLSGTDAMVHVSDAANDTILRGLVLNNNPGAAVDIDAVDNVQLYGNYLGTNITGMLVAASATTGGDLVAINSGATAPHIGGVLPAQRNIISGSTGHAIYVGGATAPTGGFIQGNYIGTAADGVSAAANTISIVLDEEVNNFLIGGDSLSARNVVENNLSAAVTMELNSFNNQIVGNRIVGNSNPDNNSANGVTTYGAQDSVIRDNIIAQSKGAGILSDASGATYSDGLTITGNNIGVLEDGVTELGNSHGGIIIYKANNSIIGGADPADANIIMHNSGYGSYESGLTITSDSTNVAILGNSIFDNNGLGIDIYGNGINPNDTNDQDIGPNELLNFPEGTSVTESGGNTKIQYRLDAPAGQYRIEFFSNSQADPSGNGEGQTFIGSQNITKTGAGYKSFSQTVTGTGYANLAFTATKIDESTPSGFGSTSEFGRMLTSTVTDLSITKTLNNPREVAKGSTLSYTVTITNNGYSDFDLADLDENDANPFAANLFVDILPPDLTFSAVTSGDASCTPYGPGTASLTPFLANHNDYELMPCAYTGPSRVLSEGDSYSVTFNTTVNNDSDLSIENFVMSPMIATDPDIGAVSAAFGGSDMMDTLLNDHNNNVAQTNALRDLKITKEIVDEGAPAADGTIQYKIKVANNSGMSIDLNDLTDSAGPFANFLFVDLMPPELTYTGITGDASCLGPLPGTTLGSSLANHQDYNVLVCGWSGGSQILSQGQSVEFIVSATVETPLPETFTNYAVLSMFGPGGYEDFQPDPDSIAYLSSTDLQSQDTIDGNLSLVQSHSSNNIAQARYGTDPEDDGGNNGGDNNNDGSSASGGLSGTGQNILIIGGIALILLAGGAILLTKLRTKKESSNQL